MKMIVRYINDNPAHPVYEDLFWGDHWPGCEKCRKVEIKKSATFVHACVLGSQLLNEELVKRQAPIVKRKGEEVRKWAEKAGVFKLK